jgi:hypothetical protein
MNPREQGDKGEVAALEWLAWKGAHVAVPIGHSPDYDLIADFGDRLVRVQVKTTRQIIRDRYVAAIATRGGNQSWSGLVKRFSYTRCDYLFVLASDGRQWFIPASRVEAGNAITLGGPKYSEYEVEPGRPFAQPAGVAPLS